LMSSKYALGKGRLNRSRVNRETREKRLEPPELVRDSRRHII
jgi:hypothetical protein